MEERTADDVAAIFSAAGDSVTVIVTAKKSDETDTEFKEKSLELFPPVEFIVPLLLFIPISLLFLFLILGISNTPLFLIFATISLTSLTLQHPALATSSKLEGM